MLILLSPLVCVCVCMCVCIYVCVYVCMSTQLYERESGCMAGGVNCSTRIKTYCSVDAAILTLQLHMFYCK